MRPLPTREAWWVWTGYGIDRPSPGRAAPALGHGAARRIFVNGRELTRVATYANGTELASLNWTRSGGFQ